MELTPINNHEFRKILRGCGIKYYCQIPRTELKARLGYCPTTKIKRKVEISDQFGFSEIFDSVAKAAKKCEISNSSVLKHALDHGNSSIRRRCVKKVFYIREI